MSRQLLWPLALAGASSLALVPALAQQKGPESILPPGFGAPTPAPAPAPAPASPAPSAAPTAPAATPTAPDSMTAATVLDNATDVAVDEGADVLDNGSDAAVAMIDLPPQAKRQ